MGFEFANYLEPVAMNPFEKYQQQSRDHFVRTVGLSLEPFQSLVELIKVYIPDQKQNGPLRAKIKMKHGKPALTDFTVPERLSHFYPVRMTIGSQ